MKAMRKVWLLQCPSPQGLWAWTWPCSPCREALSVWWWVQNHLAPQGLHLTHAGREIIA